ncbi:MAG: right-handed parallel beta-helix repeat-containing protein [Thermodesulfobacteriota bacterium]|nr:right-handed parallel beta-helix repeat-containing protein [Thermodesulfobacteriota bacterium]
MANDLTITNGQVTGPSSGTINIGNNWDVSGGTFTHNDSEVIFDATDSGNTITSGSNGTFYDLSFNGVGGGWTFQDNVDVDNNLSISNGQVTAPSSGTIIVGGNWDNSATFSHNDAAVTFDGTAQSDITGTTTFYDLTVDTNADGAKTLRFGAGEEQTVTHSLTLMGYLGKVLTIRSTSDGTMALLTLQGGASQSMDYLDVQDNDASNGQTLAVHHCTHANTTNWTFGVLGEIDHHYQTHDAAITKSCSNSTWEEVTEYKIGSNNFSAGNKYLILISFSIGMNNADQNAMARVLHGTTAFADSTYRWESRRSSEEHCGHGYHYWTVWTAVGNEDIHIEVTQPSATSYDVYTEEYEAFVIDLSADVTEGIHWFYNTATHSGYLPTSWSDGASVTFNGSNNDWLVLGFGRFDSGADTARYQMQMRNDTTDYSKVEYRVVDANDYRPQMIMVGLTDVGSNNTAKVQAAVTAASTHSWTDSKIFALNLDIFKDHSIGYSTSAVTLDGLDSWKEVYGNPSYSASQTGDVLIWSQEVADVLANDKAIYSRIQVDGLTVPANHEDAKRELPHGAIDEDAHHLIYSGPLNAGSRNIDIDMNEDVSTGASIDIHSLVVFSMELATITVSGSLYSDEGVTPITGTAKTVSLKVNGEGTYTAETNTGDGTYSISDIVTAPGDVITVFLDDEGEKAVGVTRSAGTDISDLDLYENRVIVRHEDAGPITNADLGQYDKDNDTDIHFASNANSLTVDNDNELHVWTGDSFSPGGPVTTTSGGTSPGSDIHIHVNATFTAGGSISCGGSWTAESGSTFAHNSNTVTFTATATGKTITPNGQVFLDVTFNGAGGGWTFQDNVDVDNDLTISNGQVTGPNGGTITVGRNWNNAATFNHNDGTVRFDGTVAQQVTTGGSDWNAIEVTNASSVTFMDGFTCATLTDTTAGSTLYFRSGETVTITSDGGLTLTGASGNPITLRRYLGSGTDQWNIDPQGGNWSTSYVDVQDSNNLNSTYIMRPANSTDSDNNTRWFLETTVRFGDNTGDDFTGKVQDAHMNERSGYTTYNYGGATNIASGDGDFTNRSRRALIRFMDIDSIGTDKVVTSAIMNLWCNAQDGTTPYSISAYRVLLDWGEGSSNAATQTNACCWDYASYTGTPWNTAGCSAASDVTGEDSTADRRQTAVYSRVVTGTGQYFWWDLTTAAQYWYLGPGSGGWSEYGVVLINDNEGTLDSKKSFRSHENTNDGQLPYLDVTYRSGYTVSGILYSDEGVTPITGTAKTVRLRKNGADDYTAETNTADGTFSIPSVPYEAGDVLTVYLDDETEKAVTVTLSADADISGLDLYQDRVIVRHEDDGPITNADLGEYDKVDDGDIHFTSNGTLVVDSDFGLYVWTGKHFSPGGAITTSPGGTSPGGDIHIDDNATLSAGGTISCGGSWTAETGSTFTHNSGTVTFNGTGAQTVISGGSAWNDITTTNASAGGVTFADSFTCATFTNTTAGSTLYFRYDETATITSSAGLTVTGASGNLITLRRYLGSGSDQWRIDPAGGNWNVSYVDVQDSLNLHANSINPSNSLDSGNNIKWFQDAYVDKANPSPVYPYSSWGDAANNIQDGINAAAAEDADTVIVRAGTYNENITMSDEVDVIKEEPGNRPAIVGDGTDSVVAFDGAFSSGCTLDGFDISGGGTYPGIYLHASTGNSMGNSTTIANCLVHGNNSAPGIELDGSDAATAPTIDSNDIYSNGQEGIYIRDGGSATEDVIILNNSIHDNTLDGINVGGASYVNIGDNNDIFNNTEAGIASGTSGGDLLLSGTSIIVWGNTIGGSGQGNGGAGIELKGVGSGVQLVIGGSTAGESNAISYNAAAGVSLEDIDQASLENNEISSNTEAGILFIDVTTVSPHVKTNNIHDQAGAAGINIGGASNITIGDSNDIYDNRTGIVFYVANNPNLTGTASSQPVTISENNIYTNTRAGIAVIDNATGTITIDDNKIYQNTLAGIAFFNACTAVITDNEIYTHTNAAGIFTGDWSGTSPETGSGFDRTNGPVNLTIQRNKVYGNRSGMRLDHASGNITNNLVYGNSRGGIRFGGDNTDPYVYFGISWGMTAIENNTVVNNGSYVNDPGQGISEDRGGGIVYDAISVTTDPITGFGRNFFDRPVGATQDPMTIKNNILAFNEHAGIKFCADNSGYDRSYNLFYMNFKESCATGGAIDCGRMCRARTLGTCYSPGVNCCAEEDTWAHSGVAFPGAWATGEMCGQDPLFNADFTLRPNSPAEAAGDDGNDMGAYGGTDPILW